MTAEALGAPTAEDAAAEGRAPDGGAPQQEKAARRGPSRLPLVIQPIAILVALGVLTIWLLSADLSATERTTLDPSAILAATGEHLVLTVVSAAIVLVIGIPLGILLTRNGVRRIGPAVLAVVNFGQAAPPFGLIVLIAALIGLGWSAALVALVLYALLPVLRNTIIGIEQVDQRLVEAGRGMGMSALAVLLRIELPLAVPVMLAGVRTALVLLVGTAALGAFVGAGGLGELITTGVSLYLMRVLIAGAILIALLALVIDWLGRVVEVVAHPKGI